MRSDTAPAHALVTFSEPASIRGHVHARGEQRPFEGWVELFVLLRAVHDKGWDHEDRAHQPADGAGPVAPVGAELGGSRA